MRPHGTIVIRVNGSGRISVDRPNTMTNIEMQAYLLQLAMQLNPAVQNGMQRKSNIIVPGGVN